MLDDAKHAWLPAWRAAASSGGTAAAMREVLDRFGALLDDTAGGRIVKPMVLEAPGGACAYLFLVTADASVATAVNAAVRAAGVKDRAAADPLAVAPPPPPAAPSPAPSAEPIVAAPESEPAAAPKRKGRPTKRNADAEPADEVPSPVPDEPAAEASESAPAAPSPAPAPPAEPVRAPVLPPAAKAKQPVAEALDLFPLEVPEQEILSLHRPDAAAIASSICDRFRGHTVAWQDVLRAFAATDVTPDELKKALAVLRRGGRAVYKTLKGDGDEITFPAAPAVEEKPRARPRPRKTSEDAGFFGSDED
jgi:hypothetical protein